MLTLVKRIPIIDDFKKHLWDMMSENAEKTEAESFSRLLDLITIEELHKKNQKAYESNVRYPRLVLGINEKQFNPNYQTVYVNI